MFLDSKIRFSVLFALLAMALSASAEPSKIFLNHFYTTLSAEDYQALAKSEFIKNQFAIVESRTTVRKDTSYTATYLYGSNTYIELFSLADKKPGDRALNGIGFGVDGLGEGKAFAEKFKSMLVTRELQAQQIPWFNAYYDPKLSDSSVVDGWLMEYVPDFLKLWHPEFKTRLGIERRDILERYKVSVGDGDRLFQNVTEVDLEISEKEIESFVHFASQLRLTIERSATLTTVRAADVTLHLRPGSKNKVVRAKVNLAKAVPARKIRIGKNLRLEFFGDRTAVVEF